MYESKWHDGPCCGGCVGEREEGYSGGGLYCCCNESDEKIAEVLEKQKNFDMTRDCELSISGTCHWIFQGFRECNLACIISGTKLLGGPKTAPE